MAGAVLNVVGLIAGAIPLIPVLDNLVAAPADQITSVNMGGSASARICLIVSQAKLREWQCAKGSHVQASRSTFTVKITPNEDVGNIAAEYIAITNGGHDAICIAYLTVTFATGEKTFI
ncbi:hypothetical protein PV04_07195 [Phialophora macrospora]|uniref:CARDB domain-containing protein n=1 Tax=Phialophora macrospora TaxID=1851006 RepID=A0A0D2CI51_9EURO|nr:hypothetical protein PV04_07195 [Phialophora macrospora]